MDNYLVALEGGGTRCQAAVLDGEGHVIQLASAGGVNTNFVSTQQAREAAWQAVAQAVTASGVQAGEVSQVVFALVGPHFGAEIFGRLLPNASYGYYTERDVVFARAGFYVRHGVAVVSGTGATAWAIRSDDGRHAFVGGWGALLGDEGSAYAVGLLGLRAAVRAYEGRRAQAARLVEAVCQHFNIDEANFRADLVRLAYQKPLSRAEIAGFATAVTRLAAEGDAAASGIMAKAAADLAGLGLHAARQVFERDEIFPVVAAGGLCNAGEMILKPLQDGLRLEFPHASFQVGGEAPAVALGRLALADLAKERRKDVDGTIF
jgi:N-acetylglucosamine kinase-like BadF-type ATPase